MVKPNPYQLDSRLSIFNNSIQSNNYTGAYTLGSNYDPSSLNALQSLNTLQGQTTPYTLSGNTLLLNGSTQGDYQAGVQGIVNGVTNLDNNINALVSPLNTAMGTLGFNTANLNAISVDPNNPILMERIRKIFPNATPDVIKNLQGNTNFKQLTAFLQTAPVDQFNRFKEQAEVKNILQQNTPVDPTKVETPFAQNLANYMYSASTALQGAAAIGSVFLAFKQYNQQKKMFDAQMEFNQQNLANAKKSYNAQLRDKWRGRAYVGQGRNAVANLARSIKDEEL